MALDHLGSRELKTASMKNSAVVIGAGPAGLTAAYELSKNGIQPTVIELADKVGGISRTETYKGYRFDIGGHRFFTKIVDVQRIWKEILGDEFIQVPRLSRIYYRNKFFNYPLSMTNTLKNLGVVDSVLIGLSYIKSAIQTTLKPREAENFEDWVSDRFGKRLFNTFFKTYTEKVWGMPCKEIQAEWAAQRIKGLSLRKAVTDAIFGSSDAKTLIKEFDYPLYGPGQMWERCTEIIEGNGSEVLMETRVSRVEHDGQKIMKVVAHQGDKTFEVEAEQFISSMPVTALARCMDPAPPQAVVDASKALKYRDFLIVSIIVDQEDLFPDNWIYIHSPDFKVGRIQNFKNWSPAMVPDASKTCLGMEYFCSEGDDIWSMTDEELIALASQEIQGLGLMEKGVKVEDGTVIRQRKAYPVYDADYKGHLQVVRDYLAGFENLQTVGRNGMHRYNNQDHSMMSGLLAAKNLLGGSHDLWNINTEKEYHEDYTPQELEQQAAIESAKPTVQSTKPLVAW